MITVDMLDEQIGRIFRCAFKAQNLDEFGMEKRTGFCSSDFIWLMKGRGFSLDALDVAAKSLGLGRASDVVKQAEAALEKKDV